MPFKKKISTFVALSYTYPLHNRLFTRIMAEFVFSNFDNNNEKKTKIISIWIRVSIRFEL